MEDVLRFMKALSDPTRLRIMLLLLEEELCVCELASVLEMEQSRLSHALRLLRDAGLIEERREGRWIFYKVAPLPSSLKAYLVEEAKKDPVAKTDRIVALELLTSTKPSGKRCPLREDK